ncbi:uncharacterized protein LOC133301864 [Gastrolobium bilobum]|uniref:uncharacterized protein LOC133301864 n=1 Tax=Gastrolobium bilobum TaxID=150636 RepID=UPI002AB08A61|nr:uncharacterized protein LOC133301864 [Gastrolobium bilobum]
MRDSTVQHFHQNGRAVEACAPSAERDFSSSIKTATEVLPPSFEFYVWSDEGINLHVDLNLSPSDWTNRFSNELRISENVHRNKSQSLWRDLGCLRENSTQGKSSFLWKSNLGQIDDLNGQAKSSSSLKLTKDGFTELDQQNKGDNPLISDSLTPRNMTVKVADILKENHSAVSAELTVNVVDKLGQDQSAISAEVSYGAPNNFISGVESCAKAAFDKILVSDATDTPIIKSLCGSVGNSLSDPGILEPQNSKPDNECSEGCALQNGSCFVNSDVVCAGASFSSSVELQNSEVASCHKCASVSLGENDGSLDLCDPKNAFDTEKGGLVNSSEINFDTDVNNFPSLTEEWEVGKIVDGRESSGCSQFDDPLKKSGLDSDDQDPKMKLPKKRKNGDSGVRGSSTTRILRSMKNTAVMVLPRRSMRLISK